MTASTTIDETPRRSVRRVRTLFGGAIVVVTAAIAVVWVVREPATLPDGVTQAEYEAAERRVRRVLGRDGTRLDVLSLVGEQAASQGRFLVAVACFSEIPTDHPDYGLAARLQEGEALLKLNRARDAERSLREYLSRAAGDRRVHIEHVTAARRLLAYLLSVELRFEDRKPILADLHATGKANVYDSKQFFLPTLLLARTAFGKGKLLAFLEQHPDDPRLLAALGRYHAGTGDLGAAAQTLEELRVRRPEDLVCVAALLECHFEAADRERFTELARSLPAMSPGEPWLLTQMRGQFALQEGRPEEAVRAFGQVLAEDPANPICRMGLARALGDAGRAAEREQELRTSLVLSRIRVAVAKVNESDPQSASEFAAVCDDAGLTAAAEAFRGHAARIARGGTPTTASPVGPEL